MKRYLLLLLSLVVAATASAQLQRGDKLIATVSDLDWVLAPEPIPSLASGAGLYYRGASQSAYLQFGTRYGYAVLDRLLLGTGVQGVLVTGEGASDTYLLEPFARYYLVNNPELQFFAGVGTRVQRSGDEWQAFNGVTASLGVQLPAGRGLLFTPTLDYRVMEGRNIFSFGAGLQLLLRPDEESQAPVGRFGRGSVMLGAESASLDFYRSTTAARVRVGGQYFLTDRLAAGLVAGYARQYSSFEIGNAQPDQFIDQRALQLGVSARYYLTTERHIVWFVEGGVDRLWRNFDSNTGINIEYANFTSLSAGGGAQLFIRENVALEAGPQLRYDATNPELTPGLNFGIRFIL